MTDVLNLLNLNERNLEYVFNYNKRKHFPQVDDKIDCKNRLSSFGIPVAKTLGIVDSFGTMDHFLKKIIDMQDFVIKPAKGRAGGGILLLGKKEGAHWYTGGNNKLELQDIEAHLASILFGVYSFGANDDRALIEEKIIPHSFFTNIYNEGIADIRIIIFKHKPVMAMARIPTSKSEGKANLHQGALGIGIDLNNGSLSSAALKGKLINKHPDSQFNLLGNKLPCWQKCLDIAIESSKTVDLQYLGIDLVIDKNKGPLILELNARPGLEIQVANQKLLKPILETIQ